MLEAEADEIPVAATAAGPVEIVDLGALGDFKSNSTKECGVYSYYYDCDSGF